MAKDSDLLSLKLKNNGSKVIIKIKIDDTVIARMRKGEFVQGSLHYDQWTGEKQFNAYVRKSRLHIKDKLIKKLPWGWVKKSTKRIKVYGSFPQEVGTARVMGLLDEHTHEAKEALIEREIIEFC